MAIRLENRNGEIVGVDSQGKVVDIKFGDSQFQSLDAEELMTAGRAANIVIYERSGTLYAVGDSSIVSSDSDFATVLQAAIDDLSETQGGSIYIKAGSYDVSSTITLPPDGVRWALLGAGIGQTDLTLADNVDADMFDWTPSTSTTFATIKDMRLAGNKANNTAGSLLFADTDGATPKDLRIENVIMSHSVDRCLDVRDSAGWRISNSLFEHSDSDGVFFDGLRPQMNSVYCASNSGVGFWYDGDHGTLAGIHSALNSDRGLLLTGRNNTVSCTALGNDTSNGNIRSAGENDTIFSTAEAKKGQSGSVVTSTGIEAAGTGCLIYATTEDHSSEAVDPGGGTNNTIWVNSGGDSTLFIRGGTGNLINGADRMTSIADTNKAALARGDAIDVTITVVNVTDDTVEMFTLHGGGNSVTQHGIDTTNFDTTEGNDGTVNVYWDSTNSQYEINNEEGGTRSFDVSYSPLLP